MFKNVLVLVAALAVAVMASPTPGGGWGNSCTPATYACTTDPANGCPGWEVCNVEGQWEFAGDCPPNTKCYFNEVNQSPYCI